MAQTITTVVEWVFSYMLLGFIAYELIHKFFGVTQPLNAMIMIMIIIYAMCFILLNRFIYAPNKGGIFTRLLGYHAIPLKIVSALTLLAILILHVQKELSLFGLTILTSIVVWATWKSYTEVPQARKVLI